MDKIRNLIVIGASAGGIKAISKIINGLPETIDAAIMVVLHLSRKSNPENIVQIFQRNTSLKCLVAKDETEIEKGNIYIAPPEHHLMVNSQTINLNQGPEENRHRPSVDVLFRSAAVHFGHKAIGVIASGMLYDGTSGMQAIKSCGGLCIVQDPEQAEYADMPRSVLNKIRVDYMAKLEEIPVIIQNILNKPLPPKIEIPHELKIEINITEKLMSDINQLKRIADHSDFSCPDCGGGLWKIKEDPTHRYRCHIGHVYSEKMLHELQDLKIEESIWVSIRMLEEKRNMLRLLSERRNRRDNEETLSSFAKRINDIDEHIKRLKSFVINISTNALSGD
jgi:two-component system chemotaxis response regulator CheB